MRVSWPQALAWRLRGQLLEPAGRESVAGVVQRLGGVPAMDAGLAELAVRARRTRSSSGEVDRALQEGSVIKAYAFRGATHYLSAEDGGAYLALRAAGRQWELPSWQTHYGLTPADWPAFRETVREALADGPLPVGELGRAVTRKASYRHLRPVFDDGADTLVKPLTWQGDMSFGPVRNGQHTFQRLDGNPHWTGVWGLDEAGPHVITSHVAGYGPTTEEHLHYRFGKGLSAGRARLNSWLDGLRDQLATVDVDGVTAYVLARDVDGLAATAPTSAIRFLPGHDQWVIGVGTNDAHVVSPARRSPVTRKANLVIAGGVVSGTWTVRAESLTISWFGERGTPPRAAIEEQAAHLATLLDRRLVPTVEVT